MINMNITVIIFCPFGAMVIKNGLIEPIVDPGAVPGSSAN